MKRWRSIATLVLPLFLALSSMAQVPEVPPGAQEALDEIMGLYEQEDYAGALQRLEQLAAEHELPPHVQALQGALYAELGQTSKAFESLKPLADDPQADPAVLYNAGRSALALGKLQEAEDYLQRSISMVPGSPAARELGILWAQTGRYQEAYTLLRPWAEGNPNDLDARIAAALCAVQLTRPSEAEALLSDLDQSNPRVRMLWGKLLLDKADPYGSIATLKPLAENPPPELELDVVRTLAEAYAAVGQATESVTLLTGRETGNPSVGLQLAQAQYQSGDMEGATATLQPFAETILQDLPEDSSAPGAELAISIIVEYGRLLVTAGRHEESLPYLESATQLSPGNKQSWHQLGQAYAASGRREEAQVALQKFQDIVKHEVPAATRDVQLEADLEDPTGRVLYEAMKISAQGDTEKALIMIRQEMGISPTDPRPHFLEARILLMEGDADAAMAAAERALQVQPGNPDGLYMRAVILMGMMDYPAAETGFQQVLEINPEHVAALNDYAVLLMEQERNDEARDLLEKALELRPDDTLAAENLKGLGQP